MKLRVFQSDKGDCLLLTSDAGANILVDGGMAPAFTRHVQPYLATMAQHGEKLDLVYVSHIDQDHISGILKLLDDIMERRVYDYRTQAGATLAAPTAPAMPAIGGIWHNAFSSMIGENAGAADTLLAQSSRVLTLASDARWGDLAAEHQELAYSVREAIRVSQRISADQLRIPLNKQFGGALAMVREPAGAELKLGGFAIKVIGPFSEDLDVLKEEWNEWLRDNVKTVKSLTAKARADAENIGNAGALDFALKQLGNRQKVTAPNLASLMLLVEEGSRRVLLTGDGHHQDILAGLRFHQALDVDGRLHVDVLKVQHHGSEHNIDESFCEAVSADHYVFCGNGKHENPDLDVIDMLLDINMWARPGKAYDLWFNSSPAAAPAGAARDHMKKIVQLLKAKGPAAHATAHFLTESSFELEI